MTTPFIRNGFISFQIAELCHRLRLATSGYVGKRPDRLSSRQGARLQHEYIINSRGSSLGVRRRRILPGRSRNRWQRTWPNSYYLLDRLFYGRFSFEGLEGCLSDGRNVR